MNGQWVMYLDQWGNKWWCQFVHELCEKVGYSKAEKMYVDRKGKSLHIGYVVGPHWCTAYLPYEKEA